MARYYKKSVSTLLVVVLLFAFAPLQRASSSEAATDPFAAMYDSNELFCERIAPLVASYNESQCVEAEPGYAVAHNLYSILPLSPKSGNSFSVASPETQKESSRLTAESVLEMVTLREQPVLASIFTAEEAENMRYLYEETRTDRFIVKGRNNSADTG